MATFLTIAGIIIEVLRDDATQPPSEPIGDRGRAVDGTFRSTVRATKRNWVVGTGPMLPAQEQDLRSAVDADTEVTVSGDMVGNTPVQCIVEMGETKFESDGTVDGFYRMAKLTIKEI